MDSEETKDARLKFWVDHVEAYERESRDWESRGKKIVRRYRDYRPDGQKNFAKFNILWSNVQTLHPALYDGAPNPNVDRRFEDDEEVNITVAQILERAASYYVKTNDFNDCMNQAVLDRLLPGRGVLWIRYVPKFEDKTQITSAAETQVTDDVAIDQEFVGEDVVADYVHWQDYGHTVARTWQETRAVWRKVYMDRKQLIARFGSKLGSEVPLDARALGKKADDKMAAATQGTVYELWDKITKRVYWFHKGMDTFLDEQDDPLKLKGFFPCPKPLYATLANDTMLPTADFLLYQDQANELDLTTGRIDALTKALKVVGVYDASAEGVQRMLTENVDNRLIPVEQWAILTEKGGLKGVVDFFPLDMVGSVLIGLYDAREKIKADIYEITGISDIVRGLSNANETATAQRIKGQFATLRLDNMQKEVARFSCDCVRIITEIIAEHFSIETIKEVSGVRLLTEAEKQQAMMAAQMGQQLPDHIAKLMEKPTWEQVEAVIRNDGARNFRIDIETDSTIKADQEAEKAARTEFLTAAGSFIQQASMIQVPELQPLLMEMLQFGVDGFKVGRELTTEFKMAADALKKKLEQPEQPVEDPAVAAQAQEAQMKQQESAAKMQMDQQKLGFDAEVAKAEFGIKQQELALKERELSLKEADLTEKYALEHKKAFYDAKARVPESVALTDPEFNGGLNPFEDLTAQLQRNTDAMTQALTSLAQLQQQSTAQIIEAVNRTKRVEVKRDGTGRMISAEVH